MLLKRVYANKESFKAVEFNRTGLNFIIAQKKNPSDINNKKTYNGIGKSLLVSIIHFCLGASAGNFKSFCNQLPDWEFKLDFVIGETVFTVKRATNNPDKVILNNEEMTLKKFNEYIGSLCFDIPDGINYLSFRSLIKYFIRPNRIWYDDFNGSHAHHRQYQTMLYNAFLLGLDIFLAQKKYEIKKEHNRIEKLENNFRKDDLIRDYLTGNKDVSLAIVELEEQIRRLEGTLTNFKVAENYQDVQREADRIEKELFSVSNNIILKQNNIASIDKGLQIESQTEQKDIQKIYEEVEVYFSEQLKRTLDDLENFYEKLIANRKVRLLEQKHRIEQEVQIQVVQASKLKDELDKLMKYLGEHQALDVFLSLSDKNAHLKAQLEKLENYTDLQAEYKEKLRRLEGELLQQSEKTEEFLHKTEESLSIVRDYFRNLAKRFYPNATAGITVKNNEGENQQRYSIDAKIESDNSDGINNVKIFCYDMTILFEGHSHNIDFIFHDSRLFEGIDERQKAEMFRILNETFIDSSKQYIATVNQNQLSEIKSYIGPDLYDKIVTDNTVLTLTDESDSEKLLGIAVEIDDD